MPSRRLYDYNATFRQELDRLNAAQRTAVETIEGPVMVLAGPGTGKTHLLAARIGNILLQTDAGAQNILCLTFTDAGVKAMRERLLGFIGPEAHRVGIYTFHSFCSNVIQNNLHYFGRPGLEPLSELERVRIIRELLDGLAQTDPLRLGHHETYHYERHVQDLFAQIKAQNWTEDELQQRINAYVEGLESHPDFIYKRKYKDKQAGDPKEGNIAEERGRMEKLASAVTLFSGYQEALRRLRRYDYGDMIGWVLRAFHDHPSLLRSYQERFRYLLVDEFQDTNGSQERIIRLLTDYWENPNVFIVGDDDQAIYEFQGARLNAMVDFHNRYARDLTVVTLTNNYRSTQQILNGADALITRNTLRIGERLPERGIDKRLTSQWRRSAGATPTGEENPPGLTFLNFPDHRQETGYLAGQLKRWHDGGVPWSEMAVIYAKHSQADLLRHLLERAGIPYRSKRRPNILDGRPVRQLRDLLRYLESEYRRPGTGEYLLFRVLHFRCFGLEPYDLSLLNLGRLAAMDEYGNIPGWRAYLRDYDLYPSGLEDGRSVHQVARWLEETIGQIGSLPLPEFIEYVLNGSGLLAGVLRHPNRAELLQHLATFTDFVLREIARRPRLGLGDLLETLDQMDGNRIPLPLRSHLDQADAVLLVTAHSAKGLEFEKVWMLDCSEKAWGAGGSRSRNRFKLPDTLTYAGTEDEEEARRRLFFVALTRARSEVILSCADLSSQDKLQQHVAFVDELIQEGEVSTRETGVAADALTELAHLQLTPKDDARFPLLERSAIAELLADFRLSVSALYAYLDCPLRFYYEKLLRVPDRERERTVYGSALHEALQNYFLRMKRDPDRAFPSREELIYNFEVALGQRRGLLSREGYDSRLERGRRELGSYYDAHRRDWVNEVEIEYFIRNAEVDGVPLTGIIDRVDVLSDAYVRVVDYKTSTGDRSKLKRPSPSAPYGGDYWRQLTFYKLLYDNRPGTLHRVKEGRISYLLTDPNGQQLQETIEILRQDTDALRGIIRNAWEAIQEQQFDGCGKPECEWCRFARDLTDAVPVETTEEVFGLDDVA
ncbi:DNA helicase-2/ATP-dependent DNA helicase PcrA [Neolewinella xylanilytica]|uniref:DNA 3'-5' helicase n=1 Tax=Neolewinella xylanilytica TaxID=1514080 RepID=A0A2S6I7J3_9BACT|nr:ATP-dependent DNA helicase [Neolewinella xylanilytica]PPK87448.1 DNA helicase-2/ATP-dependent DNA helicase PcrA [Neolewinella xylanilytica]